MELYQKLKYILLQGYQPVFFCCQKKVIGHGEQFTPGTILTQLFLYTYNEKALIIWKHPKFNNQQMKEHTTSEKYPPTHKAPAALTESASPTLISLATSELEWKPISCLTILKFCPYLYLLECNFLCYFNVLI